MSEDRTIAAVTAKLTGALCPNCGIPIAEHPHPDDDCILGELVRVLRERGDIEESRLLELHEKCDTDALWDDLGKVIDNLENGKYL